MIRNWVRTFASIRMVLWTLNSELMWHILLLKSLIFILGVWSMHNVIILGSNVTWTNFGVIMHLSVWSSHLLLHNGIRIIVETLSHIRRFRLAVLKGLAIPTIHLLLIDSPLIVYFIAKLILCKLQRIIVGALIAIFVIDNHLLGQVVWVSLLHFAAIVVSGGHSSSQWELIGLITLMSWCIMFVTVKAYSSGTLQVYVYISDWWIDVCYRGSISWRSTWL